MTTPQPSQPPPNPSSASKRTAGLISTPSHFNISSPAPRSIPSPIALRKEQAGKTPINHPTNGSVSSRTLGGTPMLGSLSQQGMPSSTSPNAVLLNNFGTPIGLGVAMEGITPNLGGVSMLPTMSELGLNAPKRNEDEERKLKLRSILKRIGRSKGRVSEEGIARASRRVGFQNDIDAEKLTPEERERRVGNRSISIAGNKLVIDIELKAHLVQNVQVVFDSQDKALTEVQAPAVAEVLLQDLKVDEDKTTLDAKLDRFAVSLERLAGVDRLCSAQINCFEALSGVHGSLMRLYQQERKLANDMDVMCKRSGRPTIHADGSLGLMIEYWRHRRFAKAINPKASREGAFNIRIKVSSTPGNMLPPLCATEAWLPAELELSNEDGGQSIPWQDPHQDLAATAEAILSDITPKPSDLHFVAKLEPPVVMEYTAAIRLLALFGLPPPPLASFPPQYYMQVTDPDAQSTVQQHDPEPLYVEKDVVTYKDGQQGEVLHTSTLYPNETQEYGWQIEELPFSHPRQIIEILPILRQWAQFGGLLRDQFPASGRSSPGTGKRDSTANPGGRKTNDKNLPEKVGVDLTLQCSPSPCFMLDFPLASRSPPVSLSVQVGLNGIIDIASSEPNGADEKSDKKDCTKAALALDRCCDADVWIEWLRANPHIIDL